MYAVVGEISTHTSPAVPSKVKEESSINLLQLTAPEPAPAPAPAPATSSAPPPAPAPTPAPATASAPAPAHALPCQAQLIATYTGVVTRTHTRKMFLNIYGAITALLFVSSVKGALL